MKSSHKLIIIFLQWLSRFSVHPNGNPNIQNLFHHKLEKDLGTDPFFEPDPIETKRRMETLIKKIDNNQDLFLDRTELISWIEQLLKDQDVENSMKKFPEYDLNKDGNISWEELINSTHTLTLSDLNRIENFEKQEHATLLAHLDSERKKFHLADLNHDKFLNSTEFVLFSYPEHYSQMAPIEIERALMDFDLNKDGQIDFQEFVGQDLLTNETMGLERQHFAELDVNSDGVLNGLEISTMAVPGFQHIAQGEAAHLFQETDENGDGKLSFDEVMRNLGLWMGNQATNYGDIFHGDMKEEL